MVEANQENLQAGFIKLSRSLNKHWIWQDAEKLKWWIDILLEANYADKKVLIHGQLIECKRGQSLYSLETWAKRWRIDKSQVRRFLELLKKDHMIDTENVQKTTRLTVCNYDSYNNNQHTESTQTKRKRNANETQTTPTKESKEGKELIDVDFAFNSDKFKEAYTLWLDFKKEKKQSLPLTTIKAQQKFLKKYSETDALQIIENSITNNWAGLFPLKDFGNSNNQPSPVKKMVF